MLLSGGRGSGSWMWSQNGEGGEGVFQFVSHCVKTDVEDNMKAKHRRQHTTHCVTL